MKRPPGVDDPRLRPPENVRSSDRRTRPPAWLLGRHTQSGPVREVIWGAYISAGVASEVLAAARSTADSSRRDVLASGSMTRFRARDEMRLFPVAGMPFMHSPTNVCIGTFRKVLDLLGTCPGCLRVGSRQTLLPTHTTAGSPFRRRQANWPEAMKLALDLWTDLSWGDSDYDRIHDVVFRNGPIPKWG